MSTDNNNTHELRTERVTLAVTWRPEKNLEPPAEWRWQDFVNASGDPLGPGESVRVVEDADAASDEAIAHGATLHALAEARESLAAANRGIARLTAERDAAIRERDAALYRLDGAMRGRVCLNNDRPAVRASVAELKAERTPVPDHRDLPAAVAELRERVARIEGHCRIEATKQARLWAAVIPKSVSGSSAEAHENKGGTMQPGWIRAWNREHELAAERDAARAECERLRGTVAAMEGQRRMDIEREIDVEEAWESCDIRQHWPDDEPGTSRRYAESMRLEIVRLRARVAELEAAYSSECDARAQAHRELSDLMAAVRERESGEECDHSYAAQCREAAAARDRADRMIPAPAANASGEKPQPPRGWLTEEMRDDLDEALEWLNCQTNVFAKRAAAAIATTLARETPPRVKRPNPNVVITTVDARERIDRQWIAAIRAAGGEVEE